VTSIGSLRRADAAHQQIIGSHKLPLHGAVRAERATSFIWESTRAAVADAEAWLASGGGRKAASVCASFREPATATMLRLDQLVAALARSTLWLTDA
jgi:cardiolipin synthase